VRLSKWTAFKDVPFSRSHLWQQYSTQQFWQAIPLRHTSCLGLPRKTPKTQNMTSKNVIEFLIDIILNFLALFSVSYAGYQGLNTILSIIHPSVHFKQFNALLPSLHKFDRT
jgi:hypothetical protein